jgi:hypothetical protein
MGQPGLRTVLIATGAAIALAAGVTTAYAAAAGPVDGAGVIHGCYTTTASHGSHAVVLQNAGTACPAGDTAIKWNQKGPAGPTGPAGPAGPAGPTGPQGPSGVLSMAQYDPSAQPALTGNNLSFFGSPPLETFTDGNTAAEVTGTVEQASSDGQAAGGFLGICYEPSGGPVVRAVTLLLPAFTAPIGSDNAQTVSGIVGNLTPGQYYVGLCAQNQTSNIVNGDASVTIIMAQTASGVSYTGTRHGAPPRRRLPRPVQA